MTARVLVVDDVEVNIKLLEAKLASEYFNVLSANSGKLAREVAERERPDVALLDVMMPGMDGFEVCRRLKANPQTADIPVIMVTALSDASDRLQGLEAGADDFLTKPVNDTALFARVRSLVRLKRMMEEWRLREEVYGKFASADQAGNGIDDKRPARILLFEENPIIAAQISKLVEPLASEVILARDPAEGQAKIDPEIELVIAGLSESDGALRFVSQLRALEATRLLPVVLIADEDEVARVAKGLDIGANDYLLRPLDRNELIARVRSQVRRKRVQDRLRENYQRSLSLALTDGLTGLYNRRYLAAHLDGLMARSASVLMFDIDFFKKVNDTFGHGAGDEVLIEVAARTQRNVRGFDLVARYGGEEFVVVMPETDLPIALNVAERLRKTIEELAISAPSVGRDIPITISVGVAETLAEGDTTAGLLKRADDALYAAKHKGRNCVVAWVPEGQTPPEPAAKDE